ncbi:MAG: phenylalanine--tRNA ligase subunit beta [Chloroflexota bacterium]
MKVSLNWLKEYVEVDLPAAELAGRLTMAGNEVGGMEIIGGNWEHVVIGRIEAIAAHPNADRLRLTTVDLGTERPTVVCGAPNLNIGDKVAFARVGARLIDPRSGETFCLKSARIRGVESAGMVCSERELGISDDYEGIIVLPAEAPLGMPLADYMGDTVLDLEVTPNRPDCLSVIGIAREAAALTGREVRLPGVSYEEAGPSIDGQISVEIKDPDLCPRYCASLVSGIKVAPSPRWMQERLLAAGMRPISNIVDITNYVMMEYAQPLHAFDYRKIRGQKIIVRRATAGETMVSLDGEERNLSPDMLLIADEERAVAIAGVMGGANSEVTEETTQILLEAASFNPASIHYTGRTLRLPSEACMRFERGISAEMALPALKRATQLFTELAGAKAARGVVDVYPGRRRREPILLVLPRLNSLLGVELGSEQVVATLVSLGFECKQAEKAGEVRVSAPYWRSDISEPVDLIEEVARIIGYDKIPAALLSHPQPVQDPEPIFGLKRQVRHSLAGYGFQDVVAYSLVSLEMLSRLSGGARPLEPTPLRLANPVTVEQEYLRTSLRAGLLSALWSNQKHEDGGIRLSELGRVYLPQERDLPDEREMLCAVMSGRRFADSWHKGNEPLDFFDARGVVEGLLGRLGVVATFARSEDGGLHPGRQAMVTVAEQGVGVVGEVHPQVLGAFDISGAAYILEIDLTALLPVAVAYNRFQPIKRFPAVVRDIALVVDSSVTHQRVRDIIKRFPLVGAVTLFDVYAGQPVPPGKKSLAYRITFQSPAHTLTEEEVSKVQEQVVGKLSSELGAVLRA